MRRHGPFGSCLVSLGPDTSTHDILDTSLRRDSISPSTSMTSERCCEECQGEVNRDDCLEWRAGAVAFSRLKPNPRGLLRG